MAKQKTDETAADPDAPEEAKKPSNLMRILKAVGLIAVIVLLEVVAASMLAPSSLETRMIAEQLATAKDDVIGEGDADAESAVDSIDADARQLGETREVALGSYHIVTPHAESQTSINVTFNLFGAVLAEDESLFNELFLSNEQRIKEQVLITMRGMTVTDFTDPNLGLIKRKILEKTNRALGKPLLHEAIISEFAFVER